MPDADRDRWDARYRQPGPTPADPEPFLIGLDELLPRTGRALDLAGGAGRNALWLARRGLDVTLADISPVALQLAAAQALAEGLSLRTLAVDLEAGPIPTGPWDLIVVVRFLWRPSLVSIPGGLAPGGLLVVVHPTRSNLTRHPSPGPRHLLEDGELPGLVEGLEILHHDEGWTDPGWHEARLLARRPA